MRRSSKNSPPKLGAESHRLTTVAQSILQASSRLEERACERHLDAMIQKILSSHHQDAIDAALDNLFKIEPAAYDALMESVESVSASCTVEHDGSQYDALLIAVPILAWTRFSIPSGPISADMLTTLSAHLYAHVLATDTKLAMMPTLFAIDQLPRTHAETFTLTRHMAQAALTGAPLRTPSNPPETAPFLADTRYLLAVVAAPAGAPLFHWQMPKNQFNLMSRQEAFENWSAQAKPNIERLLPGCGIELLLPEAYYVACREADKQIRPASIRAAVHYLTHTLKVESNELSAIIGNFGDDSSDGRIDEYRIGFTLRQNPEVVYGIVWPLYGQEDAEVEPGDGAIDHLLYAGPSLEINRPTPIEQILALLRECGITDIKHHAEQFPMESCEDCGAPFYCDIDAELVHAEMPEDVPPTAEHFH